MIELSNLELRLMGLRDEADCFTIGVRVTVSTIRTALRQLDADGLIRPVEQMEADGCIYDVFCVTAAGCSHLDPRVRNGKWPDGTEPPLDKYVNRRSSSRTPMTMRQLHDSKLQQAMAAA